MTHKQIAYVTPKQVAYVLYTRLTRLNPPAVVLSAASTPDVSRDVVVATFDTPRQCEDFIRTTYHQKKPLVDVLPLP